MKIKALTVCCADAGTAEALVAEYAYIGRLAIRHGRFVTVTRYEVE